VRHLRLWPQPKVRCSQTREKHARSAELDAPETNVAKTDARENDQAQDEQVAGHGVVQAELLKE